MGHTDDLKVGRPERMQTLSPDILPRRSAIAAPAQVEQFRHRRCGYVTTNDDGGTDNREYAKIFGSHPQGASLKLLSLVAKHGLGTVA